MKLHTLLIILLFPLTLLGQSLEPTETESVLRIRIINQDNDQVSIPIQFRSIKTGKSYYYKSEVSQAIEALLPNDDNNQIFLNGDLFDQPLELSDEAFVVMNMDLPYIQQGNPKLATVVFKLHTPEGKALSEPVTFTSDSTGISYEFTTYEGEGEVTVPNNDRYSISYHSAPNYHSITIPDLPYIRFAYSAEYEGSGDSVRYASREAALFKLHFVNFNNEALANEMFYVSAQSGNFSAKASTNEEGYCYISAPIGETYVISTTHIPVLEVFEVGSEPQLYEFTVTCKYHSSKIVEEIEKERQRYIEEREKAYEEAIKNHIKGLAIIPPETKPELSDTTEILALDRNKQWKNKLIILDVTGSMLPYIEQVRIWYELNYALDQNTQFVLFNDGDNKLTNEKVIGQTGGIYYCRDCNLEQFQDTLFLARKNGTGGTPPENDLEAILAGINNLDQYDEIILIADCVSKITDFELLSQINKPIRVVLCGLKDAPFNPQYLQLAYETGGSVHSIEQDITNLSSLTEGSSLIIDDKKYIFSNGVFIIHSLNIYDHRTDLRR